MMGGDKQRDEGAQPDAPDNQGRSAPDPAEGANDVPPPTPDSPEG